MSERHSDTLKQCVAREAAVLLYTSQEKEYKQAKIHAAQTLGARVLPSNAEVARELDIVADEMEGSARSEKLVEMRRDALEIMKSLKDSHPRLVGSVWRGTARRDSDIDITAFSSDAERVLLRLSTRFKVTRAKWQSAPKLNRKEESFHIYLVLASGNQVEVVVRSQDDRCKKAKCEIYGDAVTGLQIDQLERVLAEDPFKKFVP